MDVLNQNNNRLGAALIVAYIHAHDKLFPDDRIYNLNIGKIVKVAAQSCAAGERSRPIESVMTNILEQGRNSASTAQSLAATRPLESQAAASALSQSAASCTKFISPANSALNSLFGATNHSGSWVPLIINLARGDSGSGDTFRNILSEHPEAGQSVGQLIAAFVASEGGGIMELFSRTNRITLKALLLGLALEPQSFPVIHQAAIRRYGVVGGTNAARNLMQAVMNQVAEGAGQQSEQVNAALQANFGATGAICSAQQAQL